MKISEIPGIIEEYRKAAARAKEAGFDGVELSAGNGYLLDQFLQDGSNKRTDSYGGSIENRSRLLLEVVEAVTSVWGGDHVAVRIAPGGTWNHMRDSNPAALFTYVAEQLNRFGLAYLHIIEPRVKGNVTIDEGQGPVAAEQLRKVFGGEDHRSGRLRARDSRICDRDRRRRCRGVRALLRGKSRLAAAHQRGPCAHTV